MRHKPGAGGSAEKTVKDIRRATRRRHATEEKIRLYWRVCAENINRRVVPSREHSAEPLL